MREYILTFNTNYASSLEKESIALQGKYPDFLLIDAYNYLDIYEIKKPNTILLKKDDSRGDHYWDVELAKAISMRAEKLTQAILAKAFRGELVPTEAELAKREGREYEPASVLLERIRAERLGNSKGPERKRRGA